MRYVTLALLGLFSWAGAAAQTPNDAPDTGAIATATEFSIPTAAAFTLLGSTSAEITSPGFTKDIKLDYFTAGKTLKPNIAFQFQPVWLFGFQNVSLEEYRKVSPFVRALSRLSVSIGTVQDNDSVSRLAYAGRITFEKDPMMDLQYTAGISAIHDRMVAAREASALELSPRKFFLQRAIRKLQTEAGETDETNSARLREIADSIARYESDITAINAELEAADEDFNERGSASIDSFVQAYIERNWARPKLDLGFGAVNRYTSGASLTDLGLAENGYGVWVNPSAGVQLGSVGSGGNPHRVAKLLLTGLFRYTHIEGRDEVFYGGNLRVGSAKVNLFAEYTQLRQDAMKTRALAYGGSYRIGNKKLLQFGIRTAYDRDFRFKNLQPVVAIDWKLGRDVLQDLTRD